MNPAELAALEDELRKDLEALVRVRKVLAAKNGSLGQSNQQITQPLPEISREDDLSEAPAVSLRGTIEKTINSAPGVRWTTQRMLAHLQQTKFPLKAKKPIYSVGQSMQILAEAGKIRLVRRGVGSAPNIYKGKQSEETETEGGSGMQQTTV